jgi:hypothetical protein
MLDATSCSSYSSHGLSCPSCEPHTTNCHCGERVSGLWCYHDQYQLCTRNNFGTQNFICNGANCTGTIKVNVVGMRIALTPPKNPDACTCFFYTTFQIQFVHTAISCQGGVQCAGFTTYLNDGDLWPGRWISPGNCLQTFAIWYLNHCVTAPTFAGFDMTKFLSLVANVPPPCDGTSGQLHGCSGYVCPSVPSSCP